MSELTYGLDFGTTNSAIAVVRNGQVQVLPIGKDGTSIVKSVLYFRPRSHKALIGDNAIESYATYSLSGRFIKSFKSVVGFESFKGTVINGKRFTIEDLVAMFFSYIKERADQIMGQDVLSVVLGRPAVYDIASSEEQLARERLTTAANAAGFKEVNFQLEPIAAAYMYSQTITSTETVLIIDLGGGTSDFTLIKLSPQGVSGNEVILSRGVYVGGDNLDADLMRFDLAQYFGSNAKYESKPGQWLPMPSRLIAAISDWRTIPYVKNDRLTMEFIRHIAKSADDKRSAQCLLALIDDDLGFGLFQEIERVKLALSDCEQVDFHYSRSVVDIEEEVTRTRFNQVIKGSLGDIEDCISSLLTEVGYSASHIDSVVLTGGTSRVPAIRQSVEKMFGCTKIKHDNTFIDVAAGLALFSAFKKRP